jgi:hypothetical protein
MPFRVVSDVSTGISTTVEITDAEQAKQDVLIRGEIQWSNEEIFRRKITSIGVAPTEIYRVSLVQLTGYSIYVTVIGVDRGNGNVKKQTGDFTLKRLNAGPLLVGQTLNLPHQDAGAAAWVISPTFDVSKGKNDGVISVVGAAGRTIDWFVSGTMVRFTPAIGISEHQPTVPELPPTEVIREIPPDLSDFPIGETE